MDEQTREAIAAAASANRLSESALAALAGTARLQSVAEELAVVRQSHAIVEQVARPFLESVYKMAQVANAQWRDALSSIAGNLVGPSQAALAAFTRSVFDAAKFRDAFARMVEHWRECMPPNLRGLSASDVGEVVSQSVKLGLCLAWVAPTSVIEAVIHAPDVETAQQSVLAAKADILADARTILSAGPYRADAASALVEAIDVLHDGKARAAQALAATTLTDLFEEERWRLWEVRRDYTGKDPMQESVERLSTTTVLVCVADAATKFTRPDVPRRFNRHGSAHTIHENQYTEFNALAGIVLATAVLCEFERLAAEQAATA